MRRASRRDLIENPIVDDLRLHGATVYILSQKRLPDLLIGYRGRTLLLEVKDPKTWRGRQLTPEQEEFYHTWNGGKVKIVHSVEEARTALGIK